MQAIRAIFSRHTRTRRLAQVNSSICEDRYPILTMHAECHENPEFHSRPFMPGRFTIHLHRAGQSGKRDGGKAGMMQPWWHDEYHP